MALKKPITLSIVTTKTVAGGLRISEAAGDVSFPDAYHKVTEVSCGKLTQSARVTVFDKQGGTPLLIREFYDLPVDLEGGNNIAQAYEAIKALPEFAEAEDA